MDGKFLELDMQMDTYVGAVVGVGIAFPVLGLLYGVARNEGLGGGTSLLISGVTGGSLVSLILEATPFAYGVRMVAAISASVFGGVGGAAKESAFDLYEVAVAVGLGLGAGLAQEGSLGVAVAGLTAFAVARLGRLLAQPEKKQENEYGPKERFVTVH